MVRSRAAVCWVVAVLAWSGLPSCSDDPGQSADPFGNAGATSGGTSGGSGSAGATGGGVGTSCATAASCGSGLVCDPATNACSANVACSGNDDCGAAAYCDESGQCTASTTGSPCGSDAQCGSAERCIGGRCGCEGEAYGAESVPANVLIVLDRSSSMNEDIGGGTKWDIGRDAIADMLATHGDRIRFGLMLYPGLDLPCEQGMECGPGTVVVDVGDATADAINTALSDASTCSFGTPTAEALTELVGYAGLEDTTRANYILLVTDGQSTCEDPVPVVTTLRGEAPEIKTFVVGFGSGVDPNELDDMASEGGTARANGPPLYYEADSASSIADAFSTIAGSVLSCSYTLSSVPPDPNALFVYIDGVLVPRDTTGADGWDYDAGSNQVDFSGSTCTYLQSGQVTDLVIVHGCPGSTRPPGGPPDGGACVPVPGACTTNADCCSGVCSGGANPTCAESECRSFGASCVTAADCCAPVVCTDNLCSFPLF